MWTSCLRRHPRHRSTNQTKATENSDNNKNLYQMPLQPTRLAIVRSALFAVVIVIITVLHNFYPTRISETAARPGTAAVQTGNNNAKPESPIRQNSRD